MGRFSKRKNLRFEDHTYLFPFLLAIEEFGKLFTLWMPLQSHEALTSSELVILEYHPQSKLSNHNFPCKKGINPEKYQVVPVKIQHSPYLLVQMPRVAFKYGARNFKAVKRVI
jgi:hypothetical protein